MNALEIATKLGSRRKGTLARVIVNRPAKVRVKLTSEAGTIIKRSAYTVQLADYGARKAVSEAVANGEREAPTLPAWVIKTDRLPNGLCIWYHANGQQYLALPVANAKPKTQWTRDGRKVTLDDVSQYLLASELAERATKGEANDKGQDLFMAVKLENIENIA